MDVSGFASPTHADAVDLPFKRAVLDAVVGRRARLVSIEAGDELSWTDAAARRPRRPEVDSRPDGTVRAVRRRVPLGSSALGVPRARLAGSAFMGQAKKLALELHPLRWDPAQGRLVLSRTLRVRSPSSGTVPGRPATAPSDAATPGPARPPRSVFAHFHTTETRAPRRALRGRLPRRRGDPCRSPPSASSRTDASSPSTSSRPPGLRARECPLLPRRPGRRLHRLLRRDLLRPRARRGRRRDGPRLRRAPDRARSGSAPLQLARFETNRIYQSGLLEAPDIWLWDFAQSGVTKNVSLDLEGVDLASPLPARVRVFLQGASDAGRCRESTT